MVDRAGRKALFVEGGTQMIVAEVIVGVLVYHSFMPKFAANEAIKGASIAFICVFVAGFAWSWGPLGWLVPAGERPFFFLVGFRRRSSGRRRRRRRSNSLSPPCCEAHSPANDAHNQPPKQTAHTHTHKQPTKQTNIQNQKTTEVNPIETRSAGCAINTFVNFITTFIIGQFFLSMLCTMQWGVFLFFAGCVLLATLFVVFFIPETKGVPIETLNEVSFAQHWFWRRTVHRHNRHSVHSAASGSAASGAVVAAGDDLPAKGSAV